MSQAGAGAYVQGENLKIVGGSVTAATPAGAAPRDNDRQAAARRMGLSRPQLANTLQGRFGLSADRVEAVKAFLAHPPPVVQPTL